MSASPDLQGQSKSNSDERSFLNSYPNLIPLSAAEVRRNKDTTAPYQFERLYGAWCERVGTHDAHDTVLRSVERYVRALETVRS